MFQTLSQISKASASCRRPLTLQLSKQQGIQMVQNAVQKGVKMMLETVPKLVFEVPGARIFKNLLGLGELSAGAGWTITLQGVPGSFQSPQFELQVPPG